MNASEIALLIYSFYNEQMLLARAKFIFAVLLTFFFFAACREIDNANRPPTNSVQAANANSEYGGSDLPKDDIEELEKTIKLPFRPEDAIWRADDSIDAGATSKRKLLAVIKFTSADANQIVQQAEKYKPAIESEFDAETWFPAELIAQSQLSGDETLKGISYAANDFLQPPFTGGKITRVTGTDFFILELSAF